MAIYANTRSKLNSRVKYKLLISFQFCLNRFCDVCPGLTGPVECCTNCPKCFPSTARLTLENGQSIAMSELKVGDQVQTGMIKVTH